MKPIESILFFILFMTGCNSSKPQQQPTAAEQKQIQKDYQKTMEEQKKLTSGYGNSMSYVPPSTGYKPNAKQSAKKNSGAATAPSQPQQKPQQ